MNTQCDLDTIARQHQLVACSNRSLPVVMLLHLHLTQTCRSQQMQMQLSKPEKRPSLLSGIKVGPLYTSQSLRLC